MKFRPPPGLGAEVSTLADVAQLRALREPERRAYSFLGYPTRGTSTVSHLTYGELDAEARAVATHLRRVAKAGDRALLLFRPGLEFISSFFGCLYAGIVAVPAAVPRFGLRKERLQGVKADAEPTVILTTTSVMRVVEGLMDARGCHWVCSDTLDPEAWGDEPQGAFEPSDLAFLQYSSGSTGSPKGIMVSQENLLHQSEAFHRATEATRDSCLVSWLPIFHDLGLIGGALQPLYGGYPGVLISPDAFLGSPDRWLRAISDYRADISMAPNFAYELCARRSVPDRSTLDLSRWRFALNGAEPVRAHTIDEFSQAFADCGFRQQAFYPAYGLAEATLMVTGGSLGDGPTRKTFHAASLEENRAVPVDPQDASARWLVGCGVPVADQQILIVDPENQRPMEASNVGEVWVAGPSVGQGYWRRREETEEVFGVPVTGTDETWLRTGDLGFIHEGELFICGRWKDLIIIRGSNHHAPDIELTVQDAHPGLRPSSGASFSVDVGNEERLVVTQEVDRRSQLSDPEALAEAVAAIRRAIAEVHQIQVYGVVLLRHGSLSKTSSGKVQRRACRALYLEGKLKVRAEWHEVPAAQDAERLREEGESGGLTEALPADQPVDAETIRKWLAAWLARKCLHRAVPEGSPSLAPEFVETDRPFADLGLDSMMAVELIHQLESWLGPRPELDATTIWSFPNVNALARELAKPEASVTPPGPEASVPPAPESRQDVAEDVGAYSDAELLARLAEEVAMARSDIG